MDSGKRDPYRLVPFHLTARESASGQPLGLCCWGLGHLARYLSWVEEGPGLEVHRPQQGSFVLKMRD